MDFVLRKKKKFVKTQYFDMRFRLFCLLIGEQYNSWQLWYLLSTIYTLIIIGLALKMKKNSGVLLATISIIASIVSIGFTTLTNYEGELISILALFQKLIRYSFASGRLFNGMVYIPIGMLIEHNRLPKHINWIVFIAGFVANYWIENSIISSYLLIFTAIALFGIVENIQLKNSKVYPKLRSMSTIIYLVHMYIWTFYYKIVYVEKHMAQILFLLLPL